MKFNRLVIIILYSLCSSIVSYGQGKVTRPNTSANHTQQPKKTNHVPQLSISGSINGHDYVDLGLPSGTKWATCNIGANHYYDYGEYYAWAEIKSKKNYSKENCSTYYIYYADGLGEIKSDTVRAIFRIIDNPEFDAATANWGNQWSLPSSSDFTELNRQCTWELKKIGSHDGYLITGPNGNQIFLPMGGFYDGTNKSQVGSGGFYWTGDYWDHFERSTSFDFNKGSHSGTIWSNRHKGKNIRPVFKP